MDGAARPLHDAGNHRPIERGSDLQAARYGSLTTPAKPAGERQSDATPTPRPGTQSFAQPQCGCLVICVLVVWGRGTLACRLLLLRPRDHQMPPGARRNWQEGWPLGLGTLTSEPCHLRLHGGADPLAMIVGASRGLVFG